MSLLDRARHLAETLMIDQFTVTHPTGHVTVDGNGITTAETIVVYQGKGKLQTSGGIASNKVTATGDTTNAGGIVPEWALYLHLPITATGIREGDMAECTNAADPDLIGRRYRLINLQSEKTHATAKRWNVQELPKED